MKVLQYDLGVRNVIWNKPKHQPINENNTKKKEFNAHTSVTIQKEKVNRLLAAAEYMKMDYNDLMVMLINYSALNLEKIDRPKGKNRVFNQERTKNYIQINFYLNQRDYEKNMALKLELKVNISWLLSYALEHFLDQVMMEIAIKKKEVNSSLLNIYSLPNIQVNKFDERYHTIIIKWRIKLKEKGILSRTENTAGRF